MGELIQTAGSNMIRLYFYINLCSSAYILRLNLFIYVIYLIIKINPIIYKFMHKYIQPLMYHGLTISTDMKAL